MCNGAKDEAVKGVGCVVSFVLEIFRELEWLRTTAALERTLTSMCSKELLEVFHWRCSYRCFRSRRNQVGKRTDAGGGWPQSDEWPWCR